ncbi:MAG: hypothetical protein K9L56_14925 [Clostridiales bacterium]|nr:hypothetical protein [Clostridiales bacterium]
MKAKLIGSNLVDEDIELLELEEKRRKLAKNDFTKKDWDQYKKIKQQIKEIAYTPAGIFDDARFGHLRKGSELNLELLKEWRSRKMAEQKKEELKRKKENEEKESKKEPESLSSLMATLEDTLKEKELTVLTKIYCEEKKHEEIADELDISKKYSYCLLSNARKEIEEKYDLEKVVEMLEEADVSELEIKKVEAQKEAPEDELEEDEGVAKEEPEEQPREDDQDKPKGIFINFDDAATENDIDEIAGLITRIKGVSHISENNPKVEELKRKISSLMDNF